MNQNKLIEVFNKAFEGTRYQLVIEEDDNDVVALMDTKTDITYDDWYYRDFSIESLRDLSNETFNYATYPNMQEHVLNEYLELTQIIKREFREEKLKRILKDG